MRLTILPIVAAAMFSLAGGTMAQEVQMVPGNIRAIKVDGTAWQTIGNQGQRERLKEGDFLRQGNAVITSKDSRVILLFQNGSTVDLQPGTKFSVDQFLVDPFDAEKIDYRTISKEPSRSTTKLRVDDGTITAKVAKLKPASAYNIVTPLGTAGIRGTVVTVSVNPNAATFVVTEGMIQVTRNGQTFWVAEGAQQGQQQGDQQGDTRTGTGGNEQTQTVIISTDPNYTPPAGQVPTLTQQGQNFSQTANQSIPNNAFAGAPQQQAGPGGTQPDGQTGGEDDGGGSGGSGGSGGGAPALPNGFGGGGGGGGGSSGGGGQYSN